LGELIPEEWIGKYVSLELGTNEPVRQTARLDKVTDGGIIALVRVAISSQEPKGRWAAPSYLIKFVARCYPWHSLYSIRLLEPEEKETLEDWPPEM
jgi:hypothetical protein